MKRVPWPYQAWAMMLPLTVNQCAEQLPVVAEPGLPQGVQWPTR